MAALLDDIRHEIVQTRKLTESMIEEGVVEPLRPKTITTERALVTIPDPEKPWFGVKIWNDGPPNPEDTSVHVLVTVNPLKPSRPQRVEAGDWWGVDFKTAIITELLLYTETGETVVRITGAR